MNTYHKTFEEALQIVQQTKRPQRTLISYNGKEQTLNAWCREFNVNADSVRYQIKKKGKSFEEAINFIKEQGRPFIDRHKK